jgi:hypothetical protein
MEAVLTSETSVYFNETTRRYTQKTTIVKKVSKAVPLHAMEALGGRGGIAPIH